jgi:hypothetical protein
MALFFTRFLILTANKQEYFDIDKNFNFLGFERFLEVFFLTVEMREGGWTRYI